MRRALVLSAALLVLTPRVAHAEPKAPTAEEVERARTFFNAGAQAYAAARYADAVRSFEQAYALAPRSSLVFALAQAERKEYYATNDPRLLRRALSHYVEYLDQVKSGGRRAEAIEARAELEARLSRLDPQQAEPTAAPPDKRAPRLTVYSPTPGARVSVDGGALEELPYFGDLAPGRHKVRVVAEGFYDAEQEVSGDRGIDVPVNLPLRERPALVTVALDRAAEIYVDGRLVATTPVGRPIEVPPGPHVLSVSTNGKKAYSREVTLERGKPFRFAPELETSGQRVVALTMLGAGAVGLLAGGAFGLAALGREGAAEDIAERRARENISAGDLEAYNRAIDDRDAFRTASVVSLSAGAALALGGAALYLFDRPSIPVLPPRSTEPKPQPTEPTMEIGAYPVLGPGTWGGGFVARF